MAVSLWFFLIFLICHSPFVYLFTVLIEPFDHRGQALNAVRRLAEDRPSMMFAMEQQEPGFHAVQL